MESKDEMILTNHITFMSFREGMCCASEDTKLLYGQQWTYFLVTESRDRIALGISHSLTAMKELNGAK